jgi:hypothetical protein
VSLLLAKLVERLPDRLGPHVVGLGRHNGRFRDFYRGRAAVERAT